MFVLAVTSVVALTFILERGFALRWNKVVPQPVEFAVENCQSVADVPELRSACRKRPSPTSRLISLAADHLSWPKNENIDCVQTRARHEITQLERGLVVLEIVVGISPLLGLLGTIQGLMILFRDLGQATLGDNAQLARGISVALNTTFFGLAISIPSLIAWSYFSKKIETLSVEMETLCDEFLQRVYRRRKK